ncbi:MAG: hypothetical protein ACPGSD_07825 [Flavobacteriales bacterium]
MRFTKRELAQNFQTIIYLVEYMEVNEKVTLENVIVDLQIRLPGIINYEHMGGFRFTVTVQKAKGI